MLHKFFHLGNNQEANQNDKLRKMRLFINLLLDRYQAYYDLPKEISIDEKLLKYTGRVSFKQYISRKPNRLGFKLYILSDAKNGYVYNFKVYTGKENVERTGNLAQYVVLDLMKGLENKGHHL